MATVQGNVYIRSTTSNPSSTVVQTLNSLFNLFDLSGMIQVADDEFVGQSGIFSATEQVGFTTLIRPATNSTGVLGYKVYRHPSLNIYIKVTCLETMLYNTTSSIIHFRYQFSTKLDGSGGFDSAFTSPDVDVLLPINSGHNVTNSYIPTDLLPIVVSCGPDHFWVTRKQGLVLKTAITNTARFPSPYIDLFSIGVFSSQTNQNILCVVRPQNISGSMFSGITGETTSTSNSDFSGLRYLTSVDGSWSERKNCAAGYLIDAELTNTEKGVRVVQAELIVSGKSNRFNFGFVNSLVLQEHAVANVNLNGVSNDYLFAPSMGSASPASHFTMPNVQSAILLPMVAQE